MRKTYCFFLSLLSVMGAWGQHTDSVVDSIDVAASLYLDSLRISINTPTPRLQMSFLMQGICIDIVDSTQNCIVSLIVPNADIVRNQLKHHPNEVKAMHQKGGGEVRPDLLPLLSALNNVPAQMVVENCVVGQYEHHIELNKEQGNICFSIFLPMGAIDMPTDSLLINITSSPKTSYRTTEFDGMSRSKENRRPPSGLGNAPTLQEIKDRCVRIQKKSSCEKGNPNRESNRDVIGF